MNNTDFHSTITTPRTAPIGHHINCANNPFDLRPAADLIVRAANKMSAELPPNTPLVILMGENHDVPAHVELQHIVAAKLLNQSLAFTMAFEQPDNILSHILQKGMGFDLGEKNNSLIQYDPTGAITLAAHMGCMYSCFAPEAQHNLMAFCFNNGIPTIFNDASHDFQRGDGELLEITDPLVHAGAKASGVTARTINHVGVGGVAIRNWVMAHRGVAHATDSGVNLIIQNAGRSHVLGDYGRNFDYERSLTVAYRKAGAAVLPVFITTTDLNGGTNMIPPNGRGELAHSVVIEGLNETRFCCVGYDGDDAEKYNFISGAEEDFIKSKLLYKSGGLTRFFNVKNNENFYARIAEKAGAKIARLMAGDAAKHLSNDPLLRLP